MIYIFASPLSVTVRIHSSQLSSTATTCTPTMSLTARIPFHRGVSHQTSFRIATRHRTYAKDVSRPLQPKSSSKPDSEQSTIKVFSSKARQPTTPRSNEPLDFSRRSFATEQLPRPPPSTEEPNVKTFESTSKPRPYYGRPPPRTRLPLQKVRFSHL